MLRLIEEKQGRESRVSENLNKKDGFNVLFFGLFKIGEKENKNYYLYNLFNKLKWNI